MSYLIGKNSREKLISGIKKVSSIVSSTLGPMGHFVVLNGERPIITNDGATIASHIKLDDKYEAIGAELAKNVASEVANIVGDGTTTATILLSELLERASKSEEHASNITKELALSAIEAIAMIKESSRPATKDELIEIGKRACKDSVLGKNIAELIYSIGKDSYVFVEKSNTTSIEVVGGAIFQSKYQINQSDIPLPVGKIEVPVLCLDYLFTDINFIIPVIEELIRDGRKELLVISNGIDGEALRSSIMNYSRGSFTLYSVSLDDIKSASIVVGSKLYQPDDTTIPSFDDLGVAKVLLSEDKLIVLDSSGDVDKAILSLENTEDKKRKIAQLSGNVGFLRVEAINDIEFTDKRIRSDDAIRACQASLSDGVVSGGGVTYLEVSKKLKSKIMSETLQTIKNTIDKNANYIVPTDGVVDPTLVLTTALMHSTTAACQIINSEAVIL